MWRSAIVLVGCSAPVCSLDNAVAELGPPATDCGNLSWDGHIPVGNESAPFSAAHDCLLAGFAAGEPVTARWYVVNYDAGNRGAWLGVPEGSGYAIYEILGLGPMVDGYTTTSRCGAVVDLGACATAMAGLCLTCETPTTAATCGS